MTKTIPKRRSAKAGTSPRGRKRAAPAKRAGARKRAAPASPPRSDVDGGTPARIHTIRAVATRHFREKGYHAATLREIARDVGIEAPSLYNHFPSKQVLLTDILVSTMEDLIDVVRAAVDAAPDEPADKLRAATIAYVRFHEDRLDEASISDTELRALEPRNLDRIFALRHELGLVFKNVIREGVRKRVFDVGDASIGAMAVLSICARLPSWYRPEGRLRLERIGELVADSVLGAVGAR